MTTTTDIQTTDGDRVDNGQVAIVTGATRGLGAVIARTLHAAGYSVLATGSRIEAVQELADELDPSGRTAAAAVLDVRRKEDFESALHAAVAALGNGPRADQQRRPIPGPAADGHQP